MSAVDQPDERGATSFSDRLINGGLSRIIEGTDLWMALTVAGLFGLAANLTTYDITTIELVNHGNPLAISIVAFILVGLSVVVSFSDDEFIDELKDMGVYDNLWVLLESSIYLSLSMSVLGALIQAYQGLLVEVDLFWLFFYMYVFFMSYMLFAVSKLVSAFVSIGSRKVGM